MALVINTNIASLNSQRNLARSQETVNISLQRLSTGLRINSAKDDAAGLAIATRFTTQINGLNQAVRNANDGISLSQTGESAMAEITNNLQRIRELAVQSANATNSASDRAALDAEVQQRLAEITRIASQTTFNGQRILDGSFGTATFQVGANVGETIDINLNTGVRSNQIGQIATQTGSANASGFAMNTALNEAGLTVAVGTSDAVSVGASVAGTDTGGSQGTLAGTTFLNQMSQAANSAYAKVEAINAAGISGLTATASTSVDLSYTAVTGAAGQDYDLYINGYAIFENETGAISDSEFVAAINNQTANTGVQASISGGTLTLTAADGRNIAVEQKQSNTGATDEGIVDTAAFDYTGTVVDFAEQTAVGKVFTGTITLSAAETIALSGQTETIGFDTGDADVNITVDTTTLDSIDVLSVVNSETAIQRVDAALASVSSLRSDFGAIQSRFESTITNLQTIAENLTSSRSRIEDADFAAETANLTKAQILQQAGIAILAQANAIPQNVLGLLQ